VLLKGPFQREAMSAVHFLTEEESNVLFVYVVITVIRTKAKNVSGGVTPPPPTALTLFWLI
jgi:hypothetical protein